VVLPTPSVDASSGARRTLRQDARLASSVRTHQAPALDDSPA